MKEDIYLKSGWIKLDKPELEILREMMRGVYEAEGGSKKFNSHLPNYEELRTIMKNSLTEFQRENGIKIKILGQDFYDIVPGNTFFRDLFFTRKNDANSQFLEYNIDVCYLFAFRRTRLEHKLQERRATNKPQSLKRILEHQFDGDSAEHLDDGEYKIIISSTVNNMLEAEKIKNHVADFFGFEVETETRNSRAFRKGSLKEMYDGLGPNTIVFSLISKDYMQNESCLKELIEFTEHNIEDYFRHTFHIMLKDIYEGDYNIYDSLGRSEILKYWLIRIENLEENHKLLIKGNKEPEYFKTLQDDLAELKKIIENLHKIIDLLKDNPHGSIYEIFLNRVHSKHELIKLLPRKKEIHKIDAKLETTYKRIRIPSNNNPEQPEFPPMPFYKPSFPASRTYRINVPGFSNVWMKDESTNPTGTHKDRLAWEVVIKYKSLIEGLKYTDQGSLPQMSLISSGSAAIAIQHLFNLFSIPTSLKVLADKKLNPKIKEDITRIGCELYECDLSSRLLTSDDIKELTNNYNGIDITYREVLDPASDNYYDWLSYEIVREKPDFCLIPFGTGDLFINVLNIVKQEYFNSFLSKHDPRFMSDTVSLSKCHFLGASSNDPNTRLDKLFSYYLPSANAFNKYIHELKDEYRCVGNMTNYYFVDEKYVAEAMNIADKQGIKYEPSGIAGMALLLQKREEIPYDAKILIVNTGKTKDIDELIDFQQNVSVQDEEAPV